MRTLAAEEANIVSVKEATEDTRRISELFREFGDRFVVFGGVDDIALESLMLGATGWISGLTNVFPKTVSGHLQSGHGRSLRRSS